MKIELIDLTVRRLSASQCYPSGRWRDGDQVGLRRQARYPPALPCANSATMTKTQAPSATPFSRAFPLNVIVLGQTEQDGTYEIIDGRTISIAQYVAEKPGFSFEGLGFDNQQSDIKDADTQLQAAIYVVLAQIPREAGMVLDDHQYRGETAIESGILLNAIYSLLGYRRQTLFQQARLPRLFRLAVKLKGSSIDRIIWTIGASSD